MRKYRQSTIVVIELVLVIVSVFFALCAGKFNKFAGLELSEEVVFVPIIIHLGIIILLILEFIRFNKKPIIRFYFAIIFSLIAIVSMSDGVAYINSTILFFNLVYMVFLLVYIFTLYGKENQTADVLSKSTMVEKNKILPSGFYYKKDLNILFFAVLLIGIILVIISALVPSEYRIYMVCLLLMIGVIIVGSIYRYAVNRLKRIKNKYEEHLDFVSFKDEINNFFKSKLSLDVVNNLLCIEAGYLCNINLEEATKVFQSIGPIQDKALRINYDLLRLSLFLYHEYSEDFQKLYLELKVMNKTNKKVLTRLEDILQVKRVLLSDDINIMPQDYRINMKNQFKNARNACVLNRYYFLIGNKTKANEMYEFVKTEAPMLETLIQFCEKTIKANAKK